MKWKKLVILNKYTRFAKLTKVNCGRWVIDLNGFL